jgi:hypothetical protein
MCVEKRLLPFGSREETNEFLYGETGLTNDCPKGTS